MWKESIKYLTKFLLKSFVSSNSDCYVSGKSSNGTTLRMQMIEINRMLNEIYLHVHKHSYVFFYGLH